MKVDQPVGPREEAVSRSMPSAVARIVSAGHGSNPIKNPVLARVIRVDSGRYVIELGGARLEIKTQLPLRLRQMVELKPLPASRDGANSQDSRVEIRRAPEGALAIFGRRQGAVRASGGPLPAEAGFLEKGESAPRPSPAASPGQTRSVAMPSAPLETGQAASEAWLPIPRRLDLIHLRELPAAIARPQPVRLPILRIESPDLRSDEETILRIVETTGRRAIAELKGIDVAIESLHPLKPGQELLCRVLQSQPFVRLEAFGTIPANKAPSRGIAGETREVPTPFRIEVRGRRLPMFPPGSEVAARVCEADPSEAQLSLGPVRVRVRNLLGWRSGDLFHARVIRTVTPPAIEVIPGEPREQPALEMRPGLKLTATVQRQISPRRFVIQLGSRVFEGATRTPLTPDVDLMVRVERGGRQPRVRILEQSPSIEATAKQILKLRLPTLPPLDEAFQALARHVRTLTSRPTSELPERFRSALSRLQRYLENTPLDSLHGIQLRELVQRSGLGFEKRLADSVDNPIRLGQIAREDLKGMLLEMAAFEPWPASSQLLTDLRQSVEQVLGHLEVQQATNLLKSISDGGVRLLIPFSLGGHLTTAQVEIRRGRDAGKHRSSRAAPHPSTTLLFLLDLEGLGKTRIDAHVGIDSLQASFFVEEEDSVTTLRSGLPDLAHTLARGGYPSVRLEAFPLEGTDPLRIEEPVDMIASGDEEEAVRLINFRA
jgi:hypothetical protein